MTSQPVIRKLAQLDDVSITSPVDGDLAQYNAASGEWKNVPGGSRTAIVLLSDGAGDYAPQASSGMTKAQAQASALPKEFRGPTDPTGISGWTINDLDVWMAI